MKIKNFFSSVHHLYCKFINYFNIPTSKFDPTSPNIAQYTLIYCAYHIHGLGCYLFILQGFLTTKILHLAQLHIGIQLIKELIMNFVRTKFDLNPEHEQIQAHVAQIINLQSAGEKASLNLGPRSWIIAFKGKSYTRNLYKQYPRTCPSAMI